MGQAENCKCGGVRPAGMVQLLGCGGHGTECRVSVPPVSFPLLHIHTLNSLFPVYRPHANLHPPTKNDY